MEKQIFTDSTIKRELLRTYYGLFFQALLITVLFFLLLLMPVLFVTGLFMSGPGGVVVDAVISVAIGGLCYYGAAKDRIKIRQGKFRVTEDKLVGLREREGTSKTRGRGYNHYVPMTLVFASYGEFTVSDREELYTWSKVPLGDMGLFNCSNPGDEFYIVTLDRKKAIHVYPKKFFEYKK